MAVRSSNIKGVTIVCKRKTWPYQGREQKWRIYIEDELIARCAPSDLTKTLRKIRARLRPP